MLIEVYWCLHIGYVWSCGGLLSRTQSRGDQNITEHAIHIRWAIVLVEFLEAITAFQKGSCDHMSLGSNIRGGHEVL